MGVSATDRFDGEKRRPQDEYQTPVYCVEKLIPYISFHGDCHFLEPCAGEGNIVDIVSPLVKSVTTCEIKAVKDYFAFSGSADLIITNPPFSLAIDFLEKSLGEADTVVYLLRLNFFGSVKRKEFWNKNKPSHLFVLTPRPSFTEGGTDSCEYGWFCWDRRNRVKADHWLTVL